MANPTIAVQLVTMLRDAGIERVYGVVGDSLNPVVDAVRHTEGIEWVHVSNEEGWALAAAAEAQITGKLAVCAGSCGPGNTHLIQGLHDAHRSGAPVLAIASQIQSQEVGMGFFQETHPERTFQDCSSWCEVVTPKQTPHALRVAIQTAIGKRAVSVVVLPGDLAAEESAGPTVASAMVPGPSPVRPAPEQVQQLADAINAARTVTLFCGAGCRDAHDEVMELAGAVLAPVGHALAGKEWIQYDNPYDVGMNGLLGYGAAHKATHKADLLVLLGTDFPYPNFLPQRRTAQVDADPGHLGRRTPLEVAVHGDVGGPSGRCCRCWSAGPTGRSWTTCCASTRTRWRRWCRPTPGGWRRCAPSTPSTWPRSWTSWPTTTPSSPWTPACATCGRLAT